MSEVPFSALPPAATPVSVEASLFAPDFEFKSLDMDSPLAREARGLGLEISQIRDDGENLYVTVRGPTMDAAAGTVSGKLALHVAQLRTGNNSGLALDSAGPVVLPDGRTEKEWKIRRGI